MRIDNGRELLNDEIITFYQDEGITIETTTPYSPSQNSVAEHFYQTLIKLLQAIIIAKDLPISYGMKLPPMLLLLETNHQPEP